MRKTLAKFLAISSFAVCGYKAMAAGGEINNLSSIFENIAPTIQAAVNSAERMYETNGGTDSSGPRNMLESDTANPYLSELKIGKNYSIVLRLGGSTKKIIEGNHSPIPDSFKGKYFVLVPIAEDKDELITGWVCMTNLDEKVQRFAGAGDAPENQISELTAQALTKTKSGNRYLENCVYKKAASIDNMISTKSGIGINTSAAE